MCTAHEDKYAVLEDECAALKDKSGALEGHVQNTVYFPLDFNTLKCHNHFNMINR